MSYTANGVKFDTSTWIQINSGQTYGSSQPKRGTIAAWLYAESQPGSFETIIRALNVGGNFRILFSWVSTHRLSIEAKNSAGTTIINWTSPTNFWVDDTWFHFACSWDLATSTFKVFKDGVDQSATASTLTNDNVDWAGCVRGSVCGTGGANTAVTWVADLYLNTEERVDLTTDISKFISGGYAVDPGSDGSLVTGTQPEVMLTGTTSGWQTNKGTAGGYSLTSPGGGTLQDADTDPPAAPEVSEGPTLTQVIHAHVGMNIKPIGY